MFENLAKILPYVVVYVSGFVTWFALSHYVESLMSQKAQKERFDKLFEESHHIHPSQRKHD